MRSPRFETLLTCLAAILFAAVLGQAVAQQAESLLLSCGAEHQGHHEEGGSGGESHCPCDCHLGQLAVVEWQHDAPVAFGVLESLADWQLDAVEAPPASIEYPPQLA